MKQQQKPKMKKRDIENAKDTSVADFVRNLNTIIDNIYQKNKKDNDMIAIRDKFNVLRRENPVCLVEIAGPYIWKYKEKIMSENVAFFLNNSFEEEIKKAQQDSEIAEITEFEDFPVLLSKAKRTWHSFNPPEQQNILKYMKALLQSYACYVSACKNLE